MKGMRLGREKTGSSAGHKPKKPDKLMRGQKKPGPSVQAAVDLDALAEAAPYFVDARCEFAREASSLEEALERMGGPSPLSRMLGVGVTLFMGESTPALQNALLDDAEGSPFWAVVGSLPPRRAAKLTVEEHLQLLNAAKGRAGVAAVFTGLEYYRKPPYGETEPCSPPEEQQAAMRQACAFAVDCALPLVVALKPEAREEEACSAAIRDAVAVLDTCVPATWRIYFCSWGGPPTAALKLLKKYSGAVLGFNGALSFRNASHLRELAFDVALDRFVLESDAPNNPPSEAVFRHSPWTVLQLADLVATNRKTSRAVVLQASVDNAAKFFGREVKVPVAAAAVAVAVAANDDDGDDDGDDEALKQFLQ